MFTQTQENYLKEIYRLQQEIGTGVSTNSLAQLLGTSASSVSVMIKKLAAKNLVDYQKYYGVILTRKGKKHALAMLRRHRLWELFLIERLEFNWYEVNEISEQLTHVKSEKLIDAIERSLGYPKADPFGNPIPNKDGSLIPRNNHLLSECPAGTVGFITGIKNYSNAFLHYLDKQQITLGSKFTIKQKESFDDALEIKINTKSLRVSAKIASNLYVDLI